MTDTDLINKLSSYLNVKPGKLEYNEEQVITRISPKLKCSGLSTIIQTLIRESTNEAAQNLNTNNQLFCLISQWFDYIVMFIRPACTDKQINQQLLKELDATLSTRSYLVGQALSVADVAIFYSMQQIMRNLTTHDKDNFYNLSRWYNHLQQNRTIQPDTEEINFATIQLLAQTHI